MVRGRSNMRVVASQMSSEEETSSSQTSSEASSDEHWSEENGVAAYSVGGKDEILDFKKKYAPVDLPDLTKRMEDMGMLGEYQRYRAERQKWRRGELERAQNSLSKAGKSEKAEAPGFFGWNPTYEMWNWRRTMSYWISLTFLQGSAFFTVSCFLGAYSQLLGDHAKPLTAWGNFVGGNNFVAGAYLMCIETINVKGKKVTWNPFAFQKARRHLAAMQVSSLPYCASISYFIGALIYTIPVVLELFEAEYSERVELWGETVPYLVAGLCFFLGGLAECLDAEVFTSWPTHHAWWGSLLNTTGGLLFFVAAIFGVWSGFWMSILFGIGSAVFLLGSVIMVVMWKDQQFGLVFLHALNKVEQPRNSFSLRGVLFVILYSAISVQCVYNFNLRLHALIYKTFSWAIFCEAFNLALVYTLVHMYLALLSAVVRVPKIEPFHSLFIGMRWLAVPLAMNYAFDLYKFLHGELFLSNIDA